MVPWLSLVVLIKYDGGTRAGLLAPVGLWAVGRLRCWRLPRHLHIGQPGFSARAACGSSNR
ncbi:hypothetical protein ART_2967 [Arthrobacter sp. PAMC 25486]|nr:hypothetical protein ART_2967 [Arthrobacter sp. PAMC 25486]